MTTGESIDLPRLVFLEAAHAKATHMAIDALPFETGGVLLGWHEGRDVVVTDLLSIADVDAGHYHYVRNHSRAQDALCEYLENLPPSNVGYIGEWHTHPLPVPPSGTDYASLEGVVQASGRSAGMIVFAIDGNLDARVWAVVAEPKVGGVVIHDVIATHR